LCSKFRLSQDEIFVSLFSFLVTIESQIINVTVNKTPISSKLEGMGILKHVVLPGFALVHAGSIWACKDLKTWGSMVGLNDVSDEDEKSIRQKHMLGCLRGFNIGMMFLCAMGFLSENSHFRKEIAVSECLLFTAVTADAVLLGGLNYIVPGLHAAAAGFGALINSMEPGIFTKDKNA
jgi:hypothetical protein